MFAKLQYINEIAMIIAIFNAQHLFGLFRLDVDLWYATVLHALKLAEGGSATETVATRGDAVVIEEV